MPLKVSFMHLEVHLLACVGFFTIYLTLKKKFANFQHQHEEGKDLVSVAKKASNEPAFKRPRIETPSPLPTFKVQLD